MVAIPAHGLPYNPCAVPSLVATIPATVLAQTLSFSSIALASGSLLTLPGSHPGHLPLRQMCSKVPEMPLGTGSRFPAAGLLPAALPRASPSPWADTAKHFAVTPATTFVPTRI